MPTARLKVPTVTVEVAARLATVVKSVKGVTDVQVEPETHNITVTYDEGLEGTTLTAVEKALDLAGHPRASFAGGQRRRGWV